MNSWMHELASLSAGEQAGNAAPTVNTWLGRLETADTVIWWSGLVLIIVAVGLWVVRSRRDPLGDAPARPNRLLPEYVLALMVGFVGTSMIVGWLVDVLSSGGSHGVPPASPHGLESVGFKLAAGNVVQLAGGIVCLIMGAKLFDGGLTRFLLGRGRVALRVGEGLLLVVIGLTACSIVYEATVALIGLLHPGYQPPEHSVIEALRGGAGPVWILWVGAVVIAPLAEECFFRGLIQTVLGDVLKKRWPAVVITALLFGVAHSQQPQVIPTLAVLGVLLGASYERSGSLVAPMVLHSLFNLKTLIWEALGAAG